MGAGGAVVGAGGAVVVGGAVAGAGVVVVGAVAGVGTVAGVGAGAGAGTVVGSGTVVGVGGVSGGASNGSSGCPRPPRPRPFLAPPHSFVGSHPKSPARLVASVADTNIPSSVPGPGGAARRSFEKKPPSPAARYPPDPSCHSRKLTATLVLDTADVPPT